MVRNLRRQREIGNVYTMETFEQRYDWLRSRRLPVNENGYLDRILQDPGCKPGFVLELQRQKDQTVIWPMTQLAGR